MNRVDFETKLISLKTAHEQLLVVKNETSDETGNGIYTRYKHPLLTAAHTPLSWRYDINRESNPFLMERIGINAVFNAGAIYFNNRYVLMARVEGADRKSFFAIAESDNGIDNFRFRDYPVVTPKTSDPGPATAGTILCPTKVIHQPAILMHSAIIR